MTGAYGMTEVYGMIEAFRMTESEGLAKTMNGFFAVTVGFRLSV
jgi:hypothetical protein